MRDFLAEAGPTPGPQNPTGRIKQVRPHYAKKSCSKRLRGSYKRPPEGLVYIQFNFIKIRQGLGLGVLYNPLIVWKPRFGVYWKMFESAGMRPWRPPCAGLTA